MKKVLCCFLSAILVLGLAACQLGSKPEDAVKGYLDAIKSTDNEKAATFLNPANVSSAASSDPSSFMLSSSRIEKYFANYFKTNNQKITYQIKSTEIKENTAVVTVECKYVDASGILKEAFYEYLKKAFSEALTGSTKSQEESTQEVVNIFNDKVTTTKETYAVKTIKIDCVKVGDQWYINKMSNELADVASSNMVSAVTSILKNMASAYSRQQ